MKTQGLIFTIVGVVVLAAGVFVTKDYNAMVIGGLFTIAGIIALIFGSKSEQ